MHEIRASTTGTVTEVDVDEGQMVAEGDAIVVLSVPQGEVAIVTEIPGVVRELHVDPGQAVRPGDLVALIDES